MLEILFVMDALTDGGGSDSANFSELLASQQEERITVLWTFGAFAAAVVTIRIIPYAIRLFS